MQGCKSLKTQTALGKFGEFVVLAREFRAVTATLEKQHMVHFNLFLLCQRGIRSLCLSYTRNLKVIVRHAVYK